MKFRVQSSEFIGLLVSIFFLLPTTAHAAGLYFGAHGKEVSVGETFEVGVFLHTQGAEINTVAATIRVDGAATIESIREGNSFLNLWVDRPVISSDQKTVSFSGIIPGGYRGTDGYLFSVISKANKTGKITVTSGDEQLLLNDGKGTSALVAHTVLSLEAKDTGVVGGFVAPVDVSPPESFRPDIGQDPALFNNHWFVAFAAQDKGAGIASYDIFETQKNYSEQKIQKLAVPWRTVVSPVELLDQDLHSFVYVRATDRAGNVRIAQVLPRYPLPWYEKTGMWSILLGSTLLISVIVGTVWFLLRAKRRTTK